MAGADEEQHAVAAAGLRTSSASIFTESSPGLSKREEPRTVTAVRSGGGREWPRRKKRLVPRYLQTAREHAQSDEPSTWWPLLQVGCRTLRQRGRGFLP